MLSRLRHPNLVQVYDFGTTDDGIHELKAFTARQGFHLDPAITELAVTAGLFFLLWVYPPWGPAVSPETGALAESVSSDPPKQAGLSHTSATSRPLLPESIVSA